MIYYKTYENCKNKEWVVLVYGAGGSSAIWFRQLRAFKKYFNVLLIDLRGHGRSKEIAKVKKDYSFDEVSYDVLEVLNHLKINVAHFIGISLGTIIIRNIAELAPKQVKSMIMGGAVLKLNVRMKALLSLGNMGKRSIPYMWLYHLFAWCIMPRKRHKNSRQLFVEQAKKLHQSEFIKWFSLTREVTPLLKKFATNRTNIPMLYVMGDKDFMFLEYAKKDAETHDDANLTIIEESGHVCNVDQPEAFNSRSIDFLKRVINKENKPISISH